jgi:tryptophan halogenase
MKASDATYKLGVEFIGWSDTNAFVDNDTPEMNVLGPEVMMHDYILSEGISKDDFINWLPSYRLARENKSPKCNDLRLDYSSGYTFLANDAVHFNAHEVVNTLKNHCIDKLTHIDDLIIQVLTDENGISGLKTENNDVITADLYIDCTGFESLLLEKALGVPFIPIDDVLLCNSAVAIPTQYKDKHTEMHPYTKAFTMDAGWRWQIPTYSRIGNGYVYCDKFITSEDAEAELRNIINEFDTPANHIKMKTGVHENIAVKNVYAIGLAAAFAEPLEATGITFTTKAIQRLTSTLFEQKGNYDNEIAQWLSDEYRLLVQEIIDFIFCHYHFASKDDTPFWRAVHRISIPMSAKNIVNKFIPVPPSNLWEKPFYTMFHSGHWFELLYAFGAYDNFTGHKQASESVTKYGKMVWDMYNTRTDTELDIFPNHYEYLKEFYNEKNIQHPVKSKIDGRIVL